MAAPYLRDFSRTHRIISFVRALGIITVIPACSVLFILIFSRVQHSFLESRLLDYSDWNANTSATAPRLRFPARVFAPSLPDDAAANADRTVFLAPGKDNDCAYYANYFCKFWFYIRCQLLAAFPNVRVLPSGDGAVDAFARDARDGDVVILVIRRKASDPKSVPPELQAFLTWRRSDAGRKRDGVRVGVLHIANEVDRTNWPWYSAADFVLRNYWVTPLPRHAMFVPLGGHVPRGCGTARPVDSRGFTANGTDVCACEDVRVVRASTRRYLWHFSGSLRRTRGELVRRLGESAKVGEAGYVKTSTTFGGDGVVGDAARDPKIEYMETMRDSALVVCPCGNVMETHRIYEALNVGAVPLVEACETGESARFLPLKLVLVDGGPKQMVRAVEQLRGKKKRLDALQQRTMRWWQSYLSEIARDVAVTIDNDVDVRQRGRL